MKKIDYTITEAILEPYGITVDDLANTNGYQTKVANPDYVPAQGSETIVDPDWQMPEDFDETIDQPPKIPNPDYVPPVGEATMDNPKTSLVYIAELIPRMGVEKIIANYMASKIKAKEVELLELRAQPAIIAEQVVAAMTKTVTE